MVRRPRPPPPPRLPARPASALPRLLPAPLCALPRRAPVPTSHANAPPHPSFSSRRGWGPATRFLREKQYPLAIRRFAVQRRFGGLLQKLRGERSAAWTLVSLLRRFYGAHPLGAAPPAPASPVSCVLVSPAHQPQ